MKDLAAEFGIDRRTVSTHLRQAGIGTRRGGLDENQMIEAAQLYEADWSSGRLAERFGISADKVLKMLRQVWLSGHGVADPTEDQDDVGPRRPAGTRSRTVRRS